MAIICDIKTCGQELPTGVIKITTVINGLEYTFCEKCGDIFDSFIKNNFRTGAIEKTTFGNAKFIHVAAQNPLVPFENGGAYVPATGIANGYFSNNQITNHLTIPNGFYEFGCTNWKNGGGYIKHVAVPIQGPMTCSFDSNSPPALGVIKSGPAVFGKITNFGPAQNYVSVQFFKG